MMQSSSDTVEGLKLFPMRCDECRKLLARVDIKKGVVEVKCPRCGKLNLVRQPNTE